MSAEFVEKLLDTFNLEDYTIIKLMEEIAELDKEIQLKKQSFQNRLTLLRRLLQRHENAETRQAIKSFLMKLEGENRNSLTYEGGDEQANGNNTVEEEKEQKEGLDKATSPHAAKANKEEEKNKKQEFKEAAKSGMDTKTSKKDSSTKV